MTPADEELLPLDDTPPDELDPLATSHGEHSVAIPREIADDGPLAIYGRAVLLPDLPSLVAAGDRSALRALAWLESQLELGEYPPGSNANAITDWYFGWHAPWCAMTVSKALIEAGFGNPEQIDIAPLVTTSRKGWAYCPYIEADFRAAGRWYDGDPEPGDLVLYDWDGDGWADHVGMLKAVGDDGTLLVYEGNTDEGVLRLKHRSLTYVRGFARPPYAAAPPPPDPILQEDDDMAKAKPHVLLQVGSGVVALLPSGNQLTLATDRQVLGFLGAGALVLDDLTPDQIADLGLTDAQVEALPELAHLLTGDTTEAGRE